MYRPSPCTLAGLVATGLVAIGMAPAVHAQDLTLRRVMMSTGGVGYLEYRASVTGNATLGLDVRLDQVDDVLKSLVVFDDAGHVGGVELASRDNNNAAFTALPFGAEALSSPLDFLNSLSGVLLEVTGPRPMQGRLMHADKVALASPATADQPVATTVERTRVTLMSAEGIRQFILEDADTVQVADPDLRARIGQALDALRRDAGNSNRHVTLRSMATPGETGPREVRVGYVAAAPLWKTSYRLVLPPPGAPKARLQGWAVLENTTGADWKGVQLALQYGNPVTLRQAIYNTYYVQRPEVPVEVLGRLLPNVDTRATETAADEPPPPAPAPLLLKASPAPMMAAPASPGLAAPAAEAQGSEGAEDTVFAIATPVDLAAGHTASVPILDRDITASRIGLVQTGRPHPLAAIRLRNDTATSLPAGVLTLYDPTSPANFAGDARLGGLPAGESRLLSFAEDLRTTATWRSENATAIAAVTAAGGVLRVDERRRWTSHVTLTAPAAEMRDLLVEIPRRPNTTLAADNAARPAEETATAWRFAVSLAPGETRTLTVAAEQITRQQTSLLQDDSVVAQLLGRPGLTDATKAALQKLADLRSRQARLAAEADRLRAQVTQLADDEARTRANLTSVPVTDTLHGRLVRQLDSQETRIQAVQASLAQAGQAVDQASRDLASAVATFTL